MFAIVPAERLMRIAPLCLCGQGYDRNHRAPHGWTDPDGAYGAVLYLPTPAGSVRLFRSLLIF